MTDAPRSPQDGSTDPTEVRPDVEQPVGRSRAIDRPTDLTRSRYDRLALIYDLHEAPVERLLFSRWRRRLWSQVEGTELLEIGVGTGKNFPYHPDDVRVTGIDISEKMMRRARRRAGRSAACLDLHMMDAQALDFDAGRFDSGVATFVFCSVPDAVRGLREARRVLKPGGKALFLEHVRLKSPLLGRTMDLLNPLAVRITGANINRNTVSNVEAAGFSVESVTGLLGNLVLLIEARKL